MQATISLTYTFPKNGICDPPDAYHHILYAVIAMKHGPAKTEMSFKDLYIKKTLTLSKKNIKTILIKSAQLIVMKRLPSL